MILSVVVIIEAFVTSTGIDGAWGLHNEQASSLLAILSRAALTGRSISGALAPVINTHFFVSTQLPHLRAHPLLETERVLALQLGNLYMLLCLLGLFILNTTTERTVVRGYVWALWIADIGHVGATAYVMGTDAFLDFGSYNATTFGNVTATCFLFSIRSLYLLGLLGKDRVPKLEVERKKLQ